MKEENRTRANALAVNHTRTPYIFLLIGLVLMLIGSWIGLFRAPAEVFMGDVYRILYMHVPTAWNAMLALTFTFICALMYLIRGGWRWDARMEAGMEVGVVLSAMLCMQGSIWAKPTWGVWWDWDPRLTTTAIMLVAFLGILALRRFVDDPNRRATWSAVTTIVAFVDVPIVYFSVSWWNSLHQLQSSPDTVSPEFILPLRLNAFGVLALMIGWMTIRTRVAAMRLEDELGPPEPEMADAALAVEGAK